MRSSLVKRDPKGQGWGVHCTNPRGEAGALPALAPGLSLRTRISHSLETILGRNHSVFFLSKCEYTEQGAHSEAQNLFPTKSGFNSSIQSHKQADSSGAGGKSWAVPKSCGERPSPREAEAVLAQAFQDERGKDEQTRGCEAVSVDSSSRAV